MKSPVDPNQLLQAGLRDGDGLTISRAIRMGADDQRAQRMRLSQENLQSLPENLQRVLESDSMISDLVPERSEQGTLDTLEGRTETCKVCGGYDMSENMLDFCCQGLICASCNETRPKCVVCFAETPGRPRKVSYSRVENQQVITFLFDLNELLFCLGKDGVCFGCPLSGLQPGSSSNLPVHDLPSMLAHCVPLEAPFGQRSCPEVVPLARPEDYRKVFARWLYPRPGVGGLLQFLIAEKERKALDWGIYSTMTFKNAFSNFKLVMENHFHLNVNEGADNQCTLKSPGFEQKVCFFTQEECEGDSDLKYNKGSVGQLQSPNVFAKTGPHTVIVLPNAKKSKLVRKQCLLVDEFAPQQLREMTPETASESKPQWQERLLRVLRKLQAAPLAIEHILHEEKQAAQAAQLAIEHILHEENLRFVLDKRHQAWPGPARQLIVDSLVEDDKHKAKLTVQLSLIFGHALAL